MELEPLLQRGYRYALAITHDEARAEDVLHDALAAILKRGREVTVGYLFTAIRNRFIDLVRREKRVAMHPLDEGELPDVRAGSLADDPVDRERIEEALAVLSPAEREAVYLMYVEDYTAAEIGEMSGRPRGTVLSHLHRARQKMKKVLTRDGEEVQP